MTKLSNNITVPHSPSSTNHDRSVAKDKLLRNKRLDSMEKRISSTQCSVSQDINVPFDKADTNKDDGRKRIAEAVAKQRASSRASFDRF